MKYQTVGSQKSLVSSILVPLACFHLVYGEVQAGTNVTVVPSVAALTANMDVTFTNAIIGRVILPGMGTYTDNLDVVAYTAAFDTNFLAAFPSVIDNGIAIRPIEVRESTNAPRKRFYYSIDGVAAYTTTVSIANYPTNWIQTTYGNCPSWLTGAAKTTWFDQRDPARQIPCFSLISTSDVPAWCAVMTNIANSFPSSQTNLSLFQMYSNDIELVGIGVTGGMDIYIHAPTNITAVDLYKTWDLTNAFGWRLCATLDHVFDPMIYASDTSGSMANYMAGNAGVDTDGDGISDLRETLVLGTDPTLRDTVGDGLGDFVRVMTYGLTPTDVDSDKDGLSDAYEIANGLNPLSADTDGDGLSDYAEIVTYFGYTSATNADTDGDGLNDYAEVITYRTYAAPNTANTRDTDNDGLTDYQEVTIYGTNPRSADTDGDGMSDGFEVQYGLNPLNASDATQDPDHDGFNNLTEYKWCGNPTVSNNCPSDWNLIFTQGPGSNEIRRTTGDFYFTQTMGDLGVYSSLLRLPPLQFGTNMIARQLQHSGTVGFRINGTPAQSVPSPIPIPPATTTQEFRITVDPGYAGTNILFTVRDINGTAHGTPARFCSPKVTSAQFFAPDRTSTNVNYGNQGALWYPMPSDTNTSRIHICPDTTPGPPLTATRKLANTDWILARVVGPGATPSTTTLNELDWRSAYAFGSLPRTTRGMQLVPGVHTVQVGIDANANSILETNEVHLTCKVYVPKVDLTVDSDNDGTITTNDNVVEDALPGKIIFKNKDAQAFCNTTNDSDIVSMNVIVDLGGTTVPTGCYAVLEWMPVPGEELVNVFQDASATNELSWTGFHPTYSNQTVHGHLFDAGDTIPSTLYLKASTFALAPYRTDDTITHTSLSLICYRRDKKTEVCRDTVNVSIANRPSVTPKNDKFWMWVEEQTDTNRYTYASWLWNAVQTNLSTTTTHIVPYSLKAFRKRNSNVTPSDFTSLGEAGILTTSHHGGSGYVYAVAFPQDYSGYLDAQTWANTLGTNWTTNVLGYGSYMVGVKSSYLVTHWKPQRDANDSIYWAMSCFPAASNVQESLPSVLSAAGGSFNCGGLGITYGNLSGALFADCLTSMRTGKWRTTIGTCYSNHLYALAYTNVGNTRLTLWPAPLKDSTSAVFPKSHSTNGVVCLLFDTVMRDDIGTLTKVFGNARMVGTPQWIVNGGHRCGLRWSYINNTSISPTRIRAIPDKCLADPWIGDDKKKMLAGDGKSCGQNIEWEF